MREALWYPSKDFINNSNLKDYENWLKIEMGLSFMNYHELWEWSINHVEEFWLSIWQYFNIQSDTEYHTVLKGDNMPHFSWFEGSKLNYAEHILRNRTSDYPAIIFKSESEELTEISWAALIEKVSKVQHFFIAQGIKKGDRVAAYLPNIPEATIAWLATISLGAIWSSCSPDFGAPSVIDRFSQIEPKIFITIDGYQYNGKRFRKLENVETICRELSGVDKTICIPYLDKSEEFANIPSAVLWDDLMQRKAGELKVVPVEFQHPIWILYSSGTTGKPKAITHSHGGVLLEHYKYLSLHNDVHKGERFFWYSTTGWMMWNFVQASLLVGATIVLYDGSPTYPDINALWQFADKAKVHHFGTSAPFLIACMKKGITPKTSCDLSNLRSIGSTGSSLPGEAFDYVYQSIKEDVWLCSMSGGTDVCTAFVGGSPYLPVHKAEIQCRALGCALFAYNDRGERVEDSLGEMVIEKPMPSMPVFFWNDKDNQRYKASYFDTFPGVWWHGDWVKIQNDGSLLIFGRSDATLNRHGVRIGTSEIYSALNSISEIEDSLIVNLEIQAGSHYMPLFLILKEGLILNDILEDKINRTLRSAYSPRHIPDQIIQVKAIPYTISGKKMETPVKKILMGLPADNLLNVDAMKNPDSIQFYLNFRKEIVSKF